MVPQLVHTVKVKVQQPLQLRLADGCELGAHQLFPQQHAEHGGLLGVLQGHGGDVDPGAVGPGREEDLAGRLPAAESNNQLFPVGLVDFIHPGRRELIFQFLFYMA